MGSFSKAMLNLVSRSGVKNDARQTLTTTAKQKLFHRADPSDTVFLLTEGQVKLTIETNSGPQHLTLLCMAPAVIGDRDAIANVEARETATCIGTSKVCLWPRDVFIQEWSESQGLRDWLSQDLASRYALSLEMARFALLPLSLRIAHVFHSLNARGVSDWPNVKYLASVLGVTEKSIRRSISELTKSGAIDKSHTDLNIHIEALPDFEVEASLNIFHQLNTPDSTIEKRR